MFFVRRLVTQPAFLLEGSLRNDWPWKLNGQSRRWVDTSGLISVFGRGRTSGRQCRRRKSCRVQFLSAQARFRSVSSRQLVSAWMLKSYTTKLPFLEHLPVSVHKIGQMLARARTPPVSLLDCLKLQKRACKRAQAHTPLHYGAANRNSLA